MARKKSKNDENCRVVFKLYSPKAINCCEMSAGLLTCSRV